MSIDPKTFKQALLITSSEPKRAKAYLKDKRLTLQEKKILNSFFLMSLFKNEEVISELDKFTCSNPFVETQRLFCLAVSCNNLTRFSESKKYFMEALELKAIKPGDVHHNIILYSLYSLYENLKDVKGMKSTIKQLTEYPGESERAQLLVCLCKFSFDVYMLDHRSIETSLPELEKKFANLNEYQKLNYLYDLLFLFSNNEDFKGLRLVFSRLKKNKKFKNAPMLKFLRDLTDYLEKDRPFYLYENKYLDQPLFHHQIRCLNFLSQGMNHEAEAAWDVLCTEYPDEHAKGFQTKGRKTIFSLAIQKARKLSPKNDTSKIEIDEKTIEGKILAYFLTLNRPVRKEELFEEIWGDPPESKEQLNRLAKSIQRTKEKFNVEIHYSKGCYVLEQVRSKKEA